MATCAELEADSRLQAMMDVRSQLQRHVYERSLAALDAGDRARDAIASRADLDRRRQRIRAALLAGLGGLPAADGPPACRTVGTLRQDGYRIDRLVFCSRPGVHVTANLYVPDGLAGPTGAVQFLCGHSEEAKAAPRYQEVCQRLVRAGLVVLAQDPPGQGERLGYHEPALGFSSVRWGTREHDHVGGQCLALGDGLARYFLHDAMRGLDLLCSMRDIVDPARLGVTGNSGGGTQTALLMLADPRLAAAAPGTFIMDRRSCLLSGIGQDAEQHWPGLGREGFDHEDILLAMAPKPVLVLAVAWDFFPIEGARRTVERARRVWRLLGGEERLRLVVDQASHAYTPVLAEAAAAFFSEQLLGRPLRPGPPPAALPAESLRCTVSGQVRGEIAGDRTIFDEHLERVREAERARATLPPGEGRRRLVAWIAAQAGGERSACPVDLRILGRDQTCEDMRVESGFWWSQPGLSGFARVFRAGARAGEQLPVSVALWDGGTSRLHPHLPWLRRTCAAGRAALVLDVSGAGALVPHPLNQRDVDGTLHRLNDDLLWLGDSLMALRIHDALRALDAIAAWPGLRAEGIEAYAHGGSGACLAAAAACDPRYCRLVAEAVPTTASWAASRHYDAQGVRSLLLPGLLRHGDLDELLPQA